MNNENNTDEEEIFSKNDLDLDVESQNETNQENPVDFDILVSPSDPTLQNIFEQFKDDEITIPDYQRRFVWNMAQSSRLIESFLMGLPIPQVFLYINPDNTLEIIDGQQRLMSIKYFFEGYFGEPTKTGSRRKFRLKNLKQRPSYNGMTFDKLPEREQRKLRQTSLRMISIRQVYPDKHTDSVFHIFERLNTGGTNLKPQEIRNAISRGPIVDALRSLNENKDWRKLIEMPKIDKNERDVELILRIFSLYKCWQHYEGPMLQHLNKCQAENRDFNSKLALKFQDEFSRVVSLLLETVENPFRPIVRFNTAAFDSLMIAVMEEQRITKEKLKENHPKLMRDEIYRENLVGGTADKSKLQTRIRRAKEILNNDA